MKKLLLLVPCALVLTLIPGTPVPSPTASAQIQGIDQDGDGIPLPQDCNDKDPNISEEDGIDWDMDGYTPCQGDCEDGDPTVQYCRYRVIKTEPIEPMYQVPPDNCQTGFHVNIKGYKNTLVNGVITQTLVYDRDEVYLTNCFSY